MTLTFGIHLLTIRKQEVARQTIEYDDQVNVHRTIRDCLYEGDEVIARTIQQPTCVDARIEDGEIVVEVEFEIVVEVIGETKNARFNLRSSRK